MHYLTIYGPGFYGIITKMCLRLIAFCSIVHDEVGTSELQVNVTDTISDAKSEAHPGDPRAMMSTHKSKKPSGKESTAKKVSISCNEMWFGNGNDVGISEDVDDSDDSVDLGECARYWGDVYPRDQDFR